MGVPADKVSDVQRQADILVYAESFDKSRRSLVRQSFSTKIVDYLNSSRPIFAVGLNDVASIDYFIKNNSAVVSESEKQIVEKLKPLIESEELRLSYATTAYNCGKKNHSEANKAEFFKMLNVLAK